MLCIFDVLFNEKGIANSIFIPQLEADESRVTTNTLTEWAVYTPQVKKIVFKCGKCTCHGMPCIAVHEYTQTFALVNIKEYIEKGLQTVCQNNFKGFTKGDVKFSLQSLFNASLHTS